MQKDIQVMELTTATGTVHVAEVKDVNGIFKTLTEMEEEHVRHVLTHYRGNVTRTCKALGIGRSTLYRLLRTYGLR